MKKQSEKKFLVIILAGILRRASVEVAKFALSASIKSQMKACTEYDNSITSLAQARIDADRTRMAAEQAIELHYLNSIEAAEKKFNANTERARTKSLTSHALGDAAREFLK